jgi:UDP-N-acetylmuramyl tripeptide synthase
MISSEKIKVVAVTGTNGKTTTVTLLHQLFVRMGYSTGLLSTVENKINEEVIPSTHTTPDAVSVQALLRLRRPLTRKVGPRRGAMAEATLRPRLGAF